MRWQASSACGFVAANNLGDAFVGRDECAYVACGKVVEFHGPRRPLQKSTGPIRLFLVQQCEVYDLHSYLVESIESQRTTCGNLCTEVQYSQIKYSYSFVITLCFSFHISKFLIIELFHKFVVLLERKK